MDDGKILFSKSRLQVRVWCQPAEMTHLLQREIWHCPARLTSFTKQGQLISETVFRQTSFVLATDQQYLKINCFLTTQHSMTYDSLHIPTRLSLIFSIQALLFPWVTAILSFVYLQKIKNDPFVHNWRQSFQKMSSSASWSQWRQRFIIDIISNLIIVLILVLVMTIFRSGCSSGACQSR